MLATVLSLLGALLIIALIVGIGLVIWKKRSKEQIFTWKVKNDSEKQIPPAQPEGMAQEVKQDEKKPELAEEPIPSTKAEAIIEPINVPESLDQTLSQEMILEEIPTQIYNVGKSGKIYTEEELELLIKE